MKEYGLAVIYQKIWTSRSWICSGSRKWEIFIISSFNLFTKHSILDSNNVKTIEVNDKKTAKSYQENYKF